MNIRFATIFVRSAFYRVLCVMQMLPSCKPAAHKKSPEEQEEPRVLRSDTLLGHRAEIQAFLFVERTCTRVAL